MRGYQTVLAGQEAVRGMGGPLARTVGDVRLLLRAFEGLDLSSLDPRVPPVGRDDRDEPDGARVEGVRIGYYRDDGVLAPSKAVSRAVDRAVEVLRARGCAVKPFAPPRVHDVVSAYLGALSADGGAGIVAALAGGEVDPVLEPLRRMASVPGAARRVIARTARAFGQPSIALMLDAMGEKSVSELWALTALLRSQRSALVDAMEQSGVDVLVCPPFATPALPHGASKNFTLASSYAMLFNAAQLPAGVVPVTRVREGETSRTTGRDALVRQAARVDAASAALPVGVQVVGRAWRDHEVLTVMEAIERDVARDEGFPVTPVDLTT